MPVDSESPLLATRYLGYVWGGCFWTRLTYDPVDGIRPTALPDGASPTYSVPKQIDQVKQERVSPLPACL